MTSHLICAQICRLTPVIFLHSIIDINCCLIWYFFVKKWEFVTRFCFKNSYGRLKYTFRYPEVSQTAVRRTHSVWRPEVRTPDFKEYCYTLFKITILASRSIFVLSKEILNSHPQEYAVQNILLYFDTQWQSVYPQYSMVSVVL